MACNKVSHYKEGVVLLLMLPHSLWQKSQTGLAQIDVEASFSALHWNIDLTMVDRLQLVVSGVCSSGKQSSLQPPPPLEKVKHSLYMTSSNMHTIQQVCQQQSAHLAYTLSLLIATASSFSASHGPTHWTRLQQASTQSEAKWRFHPYLPQVGQPGLLLMVSS